MQFDLDLVVPTTFDVAHIGLAALAFLFLLVTLVRIGANSNSADAGNSTEATSPITKSSAANAAPPTSNSDSALQLLSLLQQEARIIDFLQENLSGFSDEDIGAAARVVHSGGQKVLKEYLELVPVRQEEEESRITLDAGFDSQANRIIGNVVGEAPYTGVLLHKGWKANKVNLPKLAPEHDASIIAAAEIEL